jgi:hypothetical protein
MGWMVMHIMLREGNAYSIFVGKPEGRRSLRDLRIDERIILNWF